LRFTITTSGGGGEQQIDGTSALAAGVSYHVTVTLNGNKGILYVNGVPVGTNSAMTLKPLNLGSTGNNYLGKSQYSDPCLDGILDEFRIYSVALAPAEVAATDALGSNGLLSTNSPTVAFSISANNLTLSWPLESASFTLQSSTNLAAGNWVTVSSPAPQIAVANFQIVLSATNTAQFFRLSR